MTTMRSAEPNQMRQSGADLRAISASEKTLGISLALGGGFSRGFAHLGVLEVLEQEQIHISAIVGTSIGGLLGAAYADGISIGQLCELGSRVRLRDFIRYQKLGRIEIGQQEPSQNAHRYDLIGRFVREWFRARRIEELSIPTAIVTTDLDTCAPHVFTRGPLEVAIRASCAFPGLFQPVEHEGKCLADGCIVAPVPTAAAARMNDCCVIGVAVGSSTLNPPSSENVVKVFKRPFRGQSAHAPDTSWTRHADLVLQPEVHHIEWNDFSRGDEARAAGAEAMRLALPHVREILARQSQVRLAERASTGAQAGWA